MRVTRIALSLLVGLASTSSSALTIGEVAPLAEVKMLNVDGRELSIDDNAEDAAKVSKTYLRDALDAVTGGSPVRVAETKAIGCSIKLR